MNKYLPLMLLTLLLFSCAPVTTTLQTPKVHSEGSRVSGSFQACYDFSEGNRTRRGYDSTSGIKTHEVWDFPSDFSVSMYPYLSIRLGNHVQISPSLTIFGISLAAKYNFLSLPYKDRPFSNLTMALLTEVGAGYIIDGSLLLGSTLLVGTDLNSNFELIGSIGYSYMQRMDSDKVGWDYPANDTTYEIMDSYSSTTQSLLMQLGCVFNGKGYSITCGTTFPIVL